MGVRGGRHRMIPSQYSEPLKWRREKISQAVATAHKNVQSPKNIAHPEKDGISYWSNVECV